MEFENKTILITGASTGIGKALGEKLAHKSCNLVLTARRDEIINEWVEKVSDCKADIFIIKNDVSDKNNIVETQKKIIEKFGNIDLAILNSGISRKVNPEKFNSEHAEEVINTNYLGVIYWIEQILPSMIKNKNGIIAPVSSLVDNHGYSQSGFYCASKAALSIFSQSLSIDIEKFGIKLLTIKPGFVETPMTNKNKYKMPFIISAEKAADIIIDGIIKEKKVIQFPLPTVIGAKIIGILPRWIYKLIK